MRNSRHKNNIAKQRRARRVIDLLKKKFGFVKKPEPTVDELWGIDELANYPVKPAEDFTIFTQEDEDDRFERHMKPIRKMQQQQVKKLSPEHIRQQIEGGS